MTRHDSRQVTPFGHPGITARLTAPPGLSRPPTSFIGPWYQGIHRPPLPTYPHTTHTYRRTTNTKMLASTMQISTHHQPTTHTSSTRHQHKPCLAPRQQPHPTHGTGPRCTGAPTPAPSGHATHDQNRTPPRGTVVLSEPQQGAWRPTHSATSRTVPHPAAACTADNEHPARTAGENRVVLDAPATKPAELASVSAHEQPGDPERVDPALLPAAARPGGAP